MDLTEKVSGLTITEPDVFANLPTDILTTIFIFITEAPDWWPMAFQCNMGKTLRYFRICTQTYNLREYFLHQYAIQMAMHTHSDMIHIPASKNIYPYLLLHYFEDKAPRKGRYNYRRFIFEFLANKNRQHTVLQYQDSYQQNAIKDICDSQGLTYGEIKWNARAKDANQYTITIHKPKNTKT